MFKIYFQKMILAVPLKPFTAILFSLLIGYLGMFLPWAYLQVTTQTENGLVSFEVPEFGKMPGIVEIDFCLKLDTEWKFTPPFPLQMEWGIILALTSMWVWMSYLRFAPRTRAAYITFFLGCLAAAFLPIGILEWLTPDSANCDFWGQTVVHGSSISWFRFFVWILSLLLGLYAIQRRALMEKQKADQL
jgi:hypothetical protein